MEPAVLAAASGSTRGLGVLYLPRMPPSVSKPASGKANIPMRTRVLACCAGGSSLLLCHFLLKSPSLSSAAAGSSLASGGHSPYRCPVEVEGVADHGRCWMVVGKHPSGLPVEP